LQLLRHSRQGFFHEYTLKAPFSASSAVRFFSFDQLVSFGYGLAELKDLDTLCLLTPI
jgi:hypothetical protein